MDVVKIVEHTVLTEKGVFIGACKIPVNILFDTGTI